MKNKFIKIHYDSKVYLSFLIIFLFGIGVLATRFIKQENCDDVDFEIIAQSFTTGDLIEFKSLGDQGFKWEWDFGDNTEKMFISDVLHEYDSIGIYNITLTVNNNCKITKQIYIKAKVIEEKIDKVLIPEIIFPDLIRVDDVVTFECTSEFANKWEWRFGSASDKVDAITPSTKYTFKEEGNYKISLVVNDNLEHALIKTINVLPKKNERRRRRKKLDRVGGVITGNIPDAPETDTIVEEVRIKLTRREAKKMIENYAEGKIDYADIQHYFCSSNIKVVNPMGKNSTLKQLLNTIRGKKIKMIDINLFENGNTGCVETIIINVKYHRRIIGWKTY